MYTLIRSIPLRRLVVGEAPAIGIALLIAEVFYKFHSFILESIAFLATWFVASWITSKVKNLLYLRWHKPSLTLNKQE
jgi:hypothetical protein